VFGAFVLSPERGPVLVVVEEPKDDTHHRFVYATSETLVRLLRDRITFAKVPAGQNST